MLTILYFRAITGCHTLMHYAWSRTWCGM